MTSLERSKILVIVLVLAMLSSGFVYGIYAYGNATGPSNNEVKDHEEEVKGRETVFSDKENVP